MVRMMTYGQANEILACNPLLTPNNRCICKSTALANHAQTAPLAPFASNRLVPVKAAGMQYGVAKQYYIIYKDTNGTVLKTEWREPGETLNPPTSDPTITGWEPNYTGIATGDATYTAVRQSAYHITFWNEDGTSPIFQYEKNAGDAMPNPAIPAEYQKEGWIASWIPQPIPATVTGDADFYLHYDIDDPHTGDVRQYFTTQALEDGTISFHLCQEAVSNVSVVKYRVGNFKKVGDNYIPVFDDPEWEVFITQGVPATINVPVRAGNIIQWRGNGSRYSYGYHEG